MDQPIGPRNPVLRALTSFGRLLTRCCTGSTAGAPRNLSAEQRTARQTQTQVSHLFNCLAPQQSPRKATSAAASQKETDRKTSQLTKDLRTLAAAHKTMVQQYLAQNATASKPTDAAELPADEAKAEAAKDLHDAQLQADKAMEKAVKDLIDTQWPGASALNLARDLHGPLAAAAQRCLEDDPEAARVLGLIENCVANAIHERANATIDRELTQTLDKIRKNELSTAISAQAKESFDTVRAVLAQLREQHLLKPTGGGTTPRRERAIAEQTAQILQLHFAALAATPEQLDTLLRHLDSESLAMLVAEHATDEIVAAAVRREIEGRIPRLMNQLEEQIRGDSASGRARSSTVYTSSLETDMQELHSLKEQIFEHKMVFGQPLDQDRFNELVTVLDQQMEHVATSVHLRPTGRGTELASVAKTAVRLLDPSVTQRLQGHLDAQIEKKKNAARANVTAALGVLAGRDHPNRTGDYLLACRNVVSALQEYLLTKGESPAQIAEPGRLERELGELIASLPEVNAQAMPHMLQTVRSAEMVRLAQVLSEAARQAQHQQLPELHADLSATVTVMSVIGAALTQKSGNAVRPNRKVSTLTHAPGALQENTRETLMSHFSTDVHKDGKVALTAGHCAKPFADKVKEVIETPFSLDEGQFVTLPGNLKVPAQFYADALRDGTDYLGPDDEPIINRRDWYRLSDNEKDERIAEGYQKLLKFYEGNETQTAGIVMNANQTLTASFKNAAQYVNDHSPLRLGEYGAGVVNRGAMNTDERTTIRFLKGENHQPQLEFSYEIRGGRFDLVDSKGQLLNQAVYLDRQRSRAKFGVKVEVDAAHGKLKVLDTPTYDVHLVRNSVQHPFSLPKPADFLDQYASPLYQAAISFAEDHSPETVPALQALRRLVLWHQGAEWPQIQKLYDAHLRPGAPSPLVETDNVRRAREVVGEVMQHTLGIFDAAKAAAQQRLDEMPPSQEVRALTQFLHRIEEFEKNPARSVADAEAILASFPLLPDSENPDRIQLPEEVVGRTYNAVNTVNQIIKEDLQSALVTLQSEDLNDSIDGMLDAFTRELQKQAAEDPTPVNLDI
ncbi:hypothetical protein [Peristeroidobacter soli]|uniref:hypothetical protein n=1 Tax=Peristeroidobacter soli TaxID=2497877 RepID=UPI00101CEB81|nr:hypothetical protein [Peristeroidobacter soli]